MKIALCTDSFFPTMGGTEYVVDIFARKLISDEHGNNEVAIFTQDFCKNNESDKEQPYKIYRTKSTHVPIFNENICAPKRDKNFAKEFLDFNPDIVHIHTPLMLGSWAVDMAKQINVKSILTVHTRFAFAYDLYTPFSKNNFIHRKIVNSLLKDCRHSCTNADILTTVSASSKENEIKKAYGVNRDILVMHNGFDIPKLEIDNNYFENNNDKNKLSIVYAGRIDITKNLDFSFYVIKGLVDRNIPLEFYLAGEGIRKKHLDKLAEKLGISDKIKWLGRLSQNELFLLHSKSDVFLFPSVFDNDSIAAIEARFCGCPTVCIKDTGTSERIVDGVNGYTADDNPDSFVPIIENIYKLKQNNYSEYLKLRQSTRDMLPETWDQVVEKYRKMYQENARK